MRAERTRWQRLAEGTIQHSGLLRVLEAFDRRWPTPRLPIVMFHRIQPPETCGDISEPDLISASPEVFAREMEYLAREFHPIGGADLLAALDGRSLPRRAVLVTFDDGTRDFLDHAWPILERLRIPSVVCVPTGFPDRSDGVFWEDRLHQVISRTSMAAIDLPGVGLLDLRTPAACRTTAFRIRSHLHGFPGAVPDQVVDGLEQTLGVRAEPFGQFLSWPELRDLDRTQLVSVVPHGRHHLRLAGAAPTAIDAEIAGSLADLRQHLPDCLPILAYPYGSYDPAVLTSARAAGYKAGLSTRSGFATLTPPERFTLRRVNIYHRTLPHFRLDLTQAFATYLAHRSNISS